MAPAAWRRTVKPQAERFPTEWAPYHESEFDGGQPTWQSEDVRPIVLEEMKAELAGVLRKSLDRLVGFPSAVPIDSTENLTNREPVDLNSLMARLRSLEETLPTFDEWTLWSAACGGEVPTKGLRAILCRLSMLLAMREPAPAEQCDEKPETALVSIHAS